MILYNLVILLCIKCQGPDISCWLSNLNISIPSIESSVENETTVYSIKLDELEINEISLNSLQTPFYPNPNTAQNGLTFFINISFHIHGVVQVQSLGVIDIDLLLTNIFFNFSLIFNQDNGFLNTITVPSDQCSLHIDSITGKFLTESKSINSMLTLFKKGIFKAIKDNIGSILCTLV